MTGSLRESRPRRIVLASIVLLVVGFSAFAAGQAGGPKAPSRRFEYVRQQVTTDSLTQTMNDLDGQGWDVFQVVPIWAIKSENDETTLSPRSYDVFGRRAVTSR